MQKSKRKWDEGENGRTTKPKKAFLSHCVKLGVTVNEALRRMRERTHSRARPHTTTPMQQKQINI